MRGRELEERVSMLENQGELLAPLARRGIDIAPLTGRARYQGVLQWFCAREPLAAGGTACGQRAFWDPAANGGRGGYRLTPCETGTIEENSLELSAETGDCVLVRVSPSKKAWEALEVVPGCDLCAELLQPGRGPTTTTPGPNSPVPQCSGQCKYIWSASTKTWTKDTDGCTLATTTTSTTAAPTTSTTPNPSTTTTTSTTSCPCPTTLAATTPTPTTPPGGSTTTTTTPAPCVCQPPQYCGTFDGECTWTFCAKTVAPAPDCTGTTTTSTTPGATTTTSTPAPCAVGCDFSGGFPGQSPGWHKTSDGCPWWHCPCQYPPSPPGICATTHMPCIVAPPTTQPPEPGCYRDCQWAWSTGGSGGWVRINFGCVGSQGCNCEPPSVPGDYCWQTAITPCAQPAGSTTAAPTTYVPTTAPPSTTWNPCSGACVWGTQDGVHWVQRTNPCFATCPCCPPGGTPRAPCETVQTPCDPHCNTTTTTTAAPTTTTSTTAAPCTGNCVWECKYSAAYYWNLNSMNCAAVPNCICGQFCPLAACDAAHLGQTVTIGCQPSNASTTACPSTTTTTSTSAGPTSSTTSTTSTTAAPTSTSPNPYCSGASYWVWHQGGGGYWQLYSHNCGGTCSSPEFCYADPPAWRGIYEGQTQISGCSCH